MDPDLRKLGKRIRDFRIAAKISQEELAARADLHRTYIGGIERGERNMGVLNLLQVARALKVDPAELVQGIR